MASKKLVVIGAGPMGLAAAYYAVKSGYSVDVIEADDRVGGMAAHFDFDGLSIERFYHFCCLTDHGTFELLDELGIGDKMKWVSTKMGFFSDGKLWRWGDPVALLQYPGLSIVSKIRYGLLVFLATKRKDWSRLDGMSAKDWLIRWSGQAAYDKLWRPLLALKFFEFEGAISAAWIWQRIKRLGMSRKSLFEERLGYIEGGSEVLMNALAAAIKEGGGRIHLKTAAQKIEIRHDVVSGVQVAGNVTFNCDCVISTVPIPYVPALLADATPAVRSPYEQMKNIAAVCVVLRLAKPVSDKFWINISDQRFAIPGIVEFTNLRPIVGATIIYVPFYMPHTNPKISAPDSIFVNESWAAVKLINPLLVDSDLQAARVGRLRYAQPVCDIGFAKKIPPYETSIRGLMIADTSFYYPEDRGVSESVRFAKQMVVSLMKH